MQTSRTRVLFVLVCCLAQAGCGGFRKRTDFSALTQPVSIQSPEPKNKYVKKVEDAGWGAMYIAGCAAALAGLVALEVLTD